MAYNGRVIDLYYDIDNGELKSDDFSTSAEAPEIRLGEAVLFRLRVKDSQKLPYENFASGTVTAACDDSFDRTDDLMLYAPDTDINVSGDWADADATKGRFAIRFNADNATFQSKLGTNAQLKMQFELHYMPTGETFEAGRVTFEVVAVNTIYLDGTPPANTVHYYTSAEADLRFMQVASGHFVWWGYAAASFGTGIDTDGSVTILGSPVYTVLAWAGTATSITCANNALTALPLIPAACTTLNASGNALTQTAVDTVLARLVASGQTGGTANLSGGTNAVPSATGLSHRVTLVGRGWTVTVNT